MKVVCPECDAVNNTDPGRTDPVCGRCKAPLEPRAPGYPLAVSDRDFEAQVIRVGLPVLVDFFASWCGPCRYLAPHLKAVARELTGRVKVVKLDTEANPVTAQRFRVTALPTLILFQGRELKRHEGLMDARGLREFAET